MRFGDISIDTMNSMYNKGVPKNTRKTNASVWNQFSAFCENRQYRLNETTTNEEIANILKDWAFNMRKTNGEDYKESVVKTLWNITAKQIQEMYHHKFKRVFNPFTDMIFKSAINARDSKRRSLLTDERKRKRSANALEEHEFEAMLKTCDEDTPRGLQKKFYLVISVELAWRGGEATKCLTHHFREEFKNGIPTGRIEYNPNFSETVQDVNQTHTTWLIENENIEMCPVRLYKKLIEKRPSRIVTNRLFLTPNPAWRVSAMGWYKNMPVGRNEIGKWMKCAAEKAGLDMSKKKITNQSSRATAVSRLAKERINERNFIKISNVYSLKPFMQLDTTTDNFTEDTVFNHILNSMSMNPDLKNLKYMGEEDGFQPLPTSFMTKSIHVGQDPEQWTSLSVIPPISLSTTFKQHAPAEYKLFEYGRSGNPSRNVLEECLAALDNGKYGLAFSSGLGATTAVISLLKSGDHIISGDDIYGGSNRLFNQVTVKFGVEPSFIDTTDLKKIEAAIQPNTKLLWLETPTNPLMKVSDVKAISTICKKHNIILVVDNSFLTPYFQRPLDLGADLVIYSITKYINGHSDVIMGSVVTKDEELHKRLRFLQNAMGIVPSPFDCYLVNRSLKTLGLRMKQHSYNGIACAKYLESHPKIIKVLHPGLPSHPQHELFKSQCSGHSSMIAFYLKGGLEESKRFFKGLKTFTLAESLGGFESLAELPVLMTHASVPAEQREKLNISDNLIRISVGLEDTEDLIEDLKLALAQV